MNKAKPQVVFFSRVNFYMLFGRIKSDLFECLHVVMNRRERAEAEAMGCQVVGCFEQEYDSLPVADIPSRFLRANFYPDRFLKPLPLEKRRELLGKMITFWRRIFDTHQPAACVHDTVSIESEEVVTGVCKQLGIHDMTYGWPPVPGFFFWKSDPYSTSISQEMWKSAQPDEEHFQIARDIVAKIRDKTFSLPYYSYFDPDFRHLGKGSLLELWVVYQLSKVCHKLPTTLGVRALRRWCRKRGYPLPCPLEPHDWRNLVFHSINCLKLPRHYIHEIYDEWCRRRYRYDNLDDYKNFRLIAYPLHFEPESTTLYFAPECSDQAATISTIARNLPLDTVLVVKEHPSQPGRLLTREFQNARLNNPNVCFLPGKVTNYEILSRCDAVATATSTLGWEALCYGKPVVVFGDVYYDKHPQVTKLTHPSQIRELDLNKLPLPKQEECELLLAKLLSLCHAGNVSVASLDDKNIANVTAAIEKELLGLCHSSGNFYNSKHSMSSVCKL